MKRILTAALAIFAFSSPALLSAPPSLGDLVDPVSGQLGSYEGHTTISQTLGASPASDMSLDTSYSYLVLASEQSEKRVLLVRTVRPQPHGLPMPPYSDAGYFWLSKSLEMIPIDDADPSPHLRVLEMQLPSAVFPGYGLPEGVEAQREEEVRMVGASKARIPVQVQVAKDGAKVTVTRTLASGKTPAMDLDGSPAVVRSWKEVHIFDAARKVLVEHRRDLEVSGERAGNHLELRLSSELKAKDVRALKEGESELVAALDKETGGILDDFHGKRHPREIYQRIQAFGDSAGGKLIAGLPDAMLSKLSFYRQARDRDQAGGASTGVVGKAAPDFTLENLEGQKVSFREATKGKVVLLTFWGFGCGPCRKEAPYLSKLQSKYGDKGFTVMAVNAYDEDKSTVQQFVNFEKLKQPVLLMGRQTGQEKYFVTMYPTNFWIDHQGKVVHKEVGFTPDNFQAMESRVERLIGESNRAALESLAK